MAGGFVYNVIETPELSTSEIYGKTLADLAKQHKEIPHLVHHPEVHKVQPDLSDIHGYDKVPFRDDPYRVSPNPLHNGNRCKY